MKSTLVVIVCMSVFWMTTLAAASSVGIATANGRFVLDGSSVAGNANVYGGSVIETDRAMSDLVLTSGLRIRLGKGSRGQIFSDRLVLERGAGQISGPNALVIAGPLHVVPLDSGSVARVAHGSGKLVEVAAVGGRVRVETAQGVRLANLESGIALSFVPQAGAASPTTLTGKVERKNGKLTLTDSTTKVTVELRGGTNLEQFAGKTVTVTGNMAASNVLQVLNIALATQVGAAAGGAAGAAAGGSAGGAAGAGVATGLSTAAIAGISIAAGTGLAVGLAGVAGAFSDESASK